MNGASANQSSQNRSSKLSISSRRRQSALPQNVRAAPGPKALDLQKRSISGSTVQPYGSVRSVPAVTTNHDSYSNELPVSDIPQFSFASIDPMQTIPRQSQEDSLLNIPTFVEPKFDFDAFQDNIIATSPGFDRFQFSDDAYQSSVPDLSMIPKFEQSKPKPPSIPIPTRKGSGVENLARKTSNASTTSRIYSNGDPVSQTAATSILRGRRQTHFPPNAFNNLPAPKAPRKSIGPGTFTAPANSEDAMATETKRRPSVNGRKSSADGTPKLAVNRVSSKSPRSSRTKSLHLAHTTSSPMPKDLLTPSKTPDGTHSFLGSQATPNRRSGTPGRTTTPGASNRRQSVATGLGARTISPTDARRLKRMSMVPPAPPLPQNRISQAPPTPTDPVPPTRPLSTTQSPVTANRKSLTPSSSRTTPDPNRKSYSSGQSLSSNTSYNSMRNSATITARLANNASTSRLPTPKPRPEAQGGAPLPTEEEIPPVPAIPKSYESPASELDVPFFSARSSGLQNLDSPLSESPNISTAAEALAELELSADLIPHSLLTAPSPSAERPSATRNPSEKSENGARLPPLNLLPLSTPTAEKIRAFKAATSARPSTPPEKRQKTPSTPMTASKATFFPKANRVADPGQTLVPRSNTSHFVLRSENHDSDESPSIPAFSFEADSASLRTVSPFLSTSAPKDNNEFPSYMRANFNTELRRTETQGRPNGPRAPSYSAATKPAESTPVSDSNTDGTTRTASTSSIQTKFARSRTDIKATGTGPVSSVVGDSTSMPPPKLPASATWGNLAGQAAQTASSSHKPSFLKSRRKTSASSSTNTLNEFERQGSVDSVTARGSTGRPSLDSMRPLMLQSNRSGSLLSTTATSKAVHVHSDTGMDRDDLIAEEEMKRLASTRRNFESAARELDGLRARAKPASRMSASGALHHVDLNIYESGEIIDFPDIFFTGTKNAKKIVGDLSTSASNFGYDDERGDYNIVEGDHLAYRYEVIDLLGKGSFGQVVRCIDHKTGILVAIKIIRNKKRFHQQALVEVDILQKLKEWDPEKKYNVVDFDQSFYFRGHLCISTDLLSMNLYEFIKAHDFRGFSLKLIRRFTKQMLQSLLLLHGKKVIHCDLKPENILLAHPARSGIKIIDFGSSCFEHEKVYTYIQSRFYRSPEVILGMSYGMPIDMWSLGCILAELYTGYPIFPGENEQEQLACIMEIFGPPEKHLIEKSSRKKLFFDSMGKPRLTVSSKGRRRRPSSKDLRQALKCDDEAFLDFIARCLRWDPTRRMNPLEATRHDFVTGIRTAPVSTRKHITSALSTPLKRGSSSAIATVAVGARPLPQPPATGLKPSVGIRHDSLGPSPTKGPTRRASNMNGLAAAVHAKRTSNVGPSSISNSSLGRVNTGSRTTNGRSDLAAAAAAASMVK